MRSLSLIAILCALAIPAGAQAPPLVAPLESWAPSKTLERAIRLYDKQDFYSASIELTKVVSGETGDDEKTTQRAELFLAKTHFQMRFYAPAWSGLARIVERPDHPYSLAAAKWLVAILRVTPNPAVRSTLFAYDHRRALDDPSLASIHDELAYHLAIEVGLRDAQRALRIFARIPADSLFVQRARLEMARVMLRDKDFAKGIDVALVAGVSPAHTAEAARLIASAAHLHGDVERARAPLAALAKTNAYARYQHSRAMLDGRHELPGLELVPVEAFDAVMLPSACRARWPDDIKPIARQVLAEARPLVAKLVAVVDHTELFHEMRKLQQSRSMPGSDVVLAALADPPMREQRAWLDEVNEEIGLVERSDRAWQTTAAADEVLQELAMVQAIQAEELGAMMRQRLRSLAPGLDALEAALAGASPAFALSAGPDGVLVVTSELCHGGGTAPVIASTTTKPRGGCAGCATSESSGAGFMLALVLAKLVPRGRRRAPR